MISSLRITSENTATAGDLSVSAEFDGDRITDNNVCITIRDEDGGARHFIEPEVLERAAKMLACLRWRAGDMRLMCGEHGYYGNDGCEPCKAAAKARAA